MTNPLEEILFEACSVIGRSGRVWQPSLIRLTAVADNIGCSQEYLAKLAMQYATGFATPPSNNANTEAFEVPVRLAEIWKSPNGTGEFTQIRIGDCTAPWPEPKNREQP